MARNGLVGGSIQTTKLYWAVAIILNQNDTLGVLELQISAIVVSLRE